MGTAASAAAELRGIAQRLGDMTPQLRVLAADIRAKIQDNIDESKSPTGAAYAAQSETTLMLRAAKARGYNINRTVGPLLPSAYDSSGRRRRTAKSWTRSTSARVLRAVTAAKPLIDTGRLRQSITTRVGPQSLSFGTNVAYAGAQHFGNPDNKMYGKYRAPIPARPFLLVAQDGRTLIPDPFWTDVRARLANFLRTGRVT